MIALAWRNLWRQPRRTLLSSLAIAFTSAFLVFMASWQYGSYNAMIENTLRLYDGYAEIQRPGYRDNPEIRHSMGDYQTLVKELSRLENITSVSVRAISYALITKENRSFAAQIIGVQVENAASVSTIPQSIKQGRYLQPNKLGEVVLGERLARNLKLRVGEKVTLLGTARDGSLAVDSLTVVGIFSTGVMQMDRLMAEMPIQRFQQSFKMQGQVHSLIMRGKNIQAFEQSMGAIKQLAEKHQLQALDWKQLQPALYKAILLDISTALPIYIAMVMVVAFSLLNSILMSVLERNREFGILLALGMQAKDIGKMLMIETLLLTLAGLFMGMLVGYGVTEYYAMAGIHFESAEKIFSEYGLSGAMYPQLSSFTLLAGPVIIGIMIMLAGIFPLIRIYRMEPVAAMRSV